MRVPARAVSTTTLARSSTRRLSGVVLACILSSSSTSSTSSTFPFWRNDYTVYSINFISPNGRHPACDHLRVGAGDLHRGWVLARTARPLWPTRGGGDRHGIRTTTHAWTTSMSNVYVCIVSWTKTHVSASGCLVAARHGAGTDTRQSAVRVWATAAVCLCRFWFVAMSIGLSARFVAAVCLVSVVRPLC